MKKTLLAVLLVLGFTALCRADSVVLQNGDKLTGTFTNVRNGNVLFKSDSIGDVTIPVGKIQSIMVAKPVVILQKDQKIARGQLTLGMKGAWEVTANGTSQTVAGANVMIILTDDAYRALGEIPSAPWKLWKGSANLGYNFQHGDQQTSTLTAVVAAVRERSVDLLFVPHMRSNYGLTALLAKADQGGTSVSSNTLSTNLREDWLFTPQNFVFGFGQLDHIDTQGIYLRQTAGGGLGRDMFHTGRSTLSLLGGFTYIHDKFIDGMSDRSAQALIGDKYGIQISKRLRFDQALTFYPDLHIHDQYRSDASASLTFKLNNHLTANAGLIDLFLRRPTAGSHQNNEAVTTGLGYTF